MKLKIKTGLILLFISTYAHGQIDHFSYKRELLNVSEKWHKIELPDDIFGKTMYGLQDIRIYGITAENDTIEVPYIINQPIAAQTEKDVTFKSINSSHNEEGYFFTFEIQPSEIITQIVPVFEQQNFDWRVKLQGSHNQREWFTITENYRIMSIHNEWTDYEFTRINFPASRYQYLRMLIKSKEQPKLSNTSITKQINEKAVFKTIKAKNTTIHTNKTEKETIVDITLPYIVPINRLKINVADTIDYYRPVIIQYLADSMKTERGWIYNYATIDYEALNSNDSTEFTCNSTLLQQIRIRILNQDNQPLTIGNIEIKGPVYDIIARFTEPADYYLVYGNEQAAKPSYDIERFIEKIPDSITSLKLGDELYTLKKKNTSGEPLFANKAWLWIIMSVIILTLGWFTLKMMREKN